MTKIGNKLGSKLVSLKCFVTIVLFMGALSQSWAQIGLPPVIDPLLGQPASQTAVVGASVRFSVLATSLTTPTYQWRLRGTNIPNATASSYVRQNVQSSDAGKYSVVVRNASGSTTSADATLTVDASPVRLTTTILSDGSLKLRIVGPLVGTYEVQSSADLKTWNTVSTHLVVAGLLDLTLAKTSLNQNGRFYRVRVY